MRNIRSMTVTQHRIFEADQIIFSLIARPVGLNALKELLSFRAAAVNTESGDLVFQDGSCQIGDATVLVGSVILNDRRLAINVEGDSRAAHLVFGLIAEFFLQLGETFKQGKPPLESIEPLVFTEETMAVVELDFDWPQLFSQELVAAAEGFTARAKPVAMTIRNALARFTISYFQNDPRLKEGGVAFADKVLAIEPRIDVPFSERVYFTTSPSDSETHMGMVRALEEALTRKTKKKKG